jgi:hypothetical protein
MKYIKSILILSFLLFPIPKAYSQEVSPTPSSASQYNYNIPATTPTATPVTPSTFPLSTTSSTSTPTFPAFPTNPAQSLLPSWSVGNTGSTSYSGTGMNGGSYSGSSTFGNTYNSSGYNFPNQSGSCGIGGYADIVTGKTGANSLSSSADLNANAMAARVGISISSQPCMDYSKIEKQRSDTEVGKTKAQEEGQTKRRCVEAITEAGKLPPTPQSQKAMENLMIICTSVMKG